VRALRAQNEACAGGVPSGSTDWVFLHKHCCKLKATNIPYPKSSWHVVVPGEEIVAVTAP